MQELPSLSSSRINNSRRKRKPKISNLNSNSNALSKTRRNSNKERSSNVPNNPGYNNNSGRKYSLSKEHNNNSICRLSVYLSHMELARKLRKVEMPDVFRKEPLLSARVPEPFLGPCDDLPLPPGDMGLDIEAEIAVILGDVPYATPAARALPSSPSAASSK